MAETDAAISKWVQEKSGEINHKNFEGYIGRQPHPPLEISLTKSAEAVKQ
jgi:hypothetical protein